MGVRGDRGSRQLEPTPGNPLTARTIRLSLYGNHVTVFPKRQEVIGEHVCDVTQFINIHGMAIVPVKSRFPPDIYLWNEKNHSINGRQNMLLFGR